MTHSTDRADSRVWQLAEQSETAFDVLARVIHETGESLAVWTVICPDIEPLLETLHDVRGAASRRLGNARAVRIPDRRGEFLIVLIPAGHLGVWHIATFVPATDPRWGVLRSMQSRFDHHLASIFLNEHDFLSISDRLGEFGDVSVSRMTARKVSDGSSINRGWQQGAYTGPPPRDVIEEFPDVSVRTLTLSVSDTLRCHLRREGGATFYSGDFGIFCGVVLGAFETASAERLELLSGRSRAVGEPAAAPLAVRFDDRRFADRGNVQRLAETIQRDHSFGVAVLHGNPYLHLVVTDYLDGSNFNVFVADENEIRIVPGFRATVSSLARFTDNLGDRLGGDIVGEARHVPQVAASDLFVRP